jgi:hypothetical protein
MIVLLAFIRRATPNEKQVLGGSEGLLHSPQLLVAEHGFDRVEIGARKPGGTVAGITSNGNRAWYVLRRIIEGGEGAPLESGHHFGSQTIQRIHNVFGRTLSFTAS